MVGRSAGRQQADRGVDDRLFIHHPRHRTIVLPLAADFGEAVHRLAGQRRTQRGVGWHKGRSRNVEPHQLHHHLVRIGRAIEGAGAGGVIAGALALQQVGPRCLAFGVKLADLLLVLVGQAGRHRPAGHEDRRQVAKAQRADELARHDLVADAQDRHAIEHRVAHRHGGRQRDHIAAEQRQLHAVLPLGHPIAHRRNAARHLHGRADFAGIELHGFGVAAIGLMRRKHIVIGGDDCQVRPAPALDRALVLQRRGKAVGEV